MTHVSHNQAVLRDSEEHEVAIGKNRRNTDARHVTLYRDIRKLRDPIYC